MFLYAIYLSYIPQIAVVAILLSLKRRDRDLSDFLLLFFGTSLFSIVISAIWPATNPFIHFGLVSASEASPWSQFAALRDGSLRSLDLANAQGLVSIPSLHAAHAVLLAYATRHLRRVFPVMLTLNGMMIYAAIVCGAHYLVDIIAGVAVAGAGILILRRMSQTPLGRT